MSYTCIQTHRGPTGRKVANGEPMRQGESRERAVRAKRPMSALSVAMPPKINMAVTIKQAMRLKKRRFKRAATPQRK